MVPRRWLGVALDTATAKLGDQFGLAGQRCCGDPLASCRLIQTMPTRGSPHLTPGNRSRPGDIRLLGSVEADDAGADFGHRLAKLFGQQHLDL